LALRWKSAFFLSTPARSYTSSVTRSHMFDFNKLGDLSKIAGEARQLQERQEHMQREQIELLKKISDKLDQILIVLKTKS